MRSDRRKARNAPYGIAPWFGVLVALFITGIAFLLASRGSIPGQPFLMTCAEWWLADPRGMLHRMTPYPGGLIPQRPYTLGGPVACLSVATPQAGGPVGL